MEPEPGWYYAKGDPVGTVRLWNGHGWVGFPQRDPDLVEIIVPDDPEPEAGQRRLRSLATWAQVAIGAAALALSFSIYLDVRMINLVDDFAGGRFIDFLGEQADLQQLAAKAFFVTLCLSLIALALVVAWFWRAYQNLSLWHDQYYDTIWGVFAWLVPILNLVRPGQMMLELAERSPRDENEGAINPILAWGWWMLSVGAALGGLLSAVLRPEELVSIRNASWLSIGVTIATLASVMLLLALIDQITKHQDSRFGAEKIIDLRNLEADGGPIVF